MKSRRKRTLFDHFAGVGKNVLKLGVVMAAVLAGSPLGGLASAETADAPPAIPLAAEMRMVGSASGVARVEIPEGATIDMRIASPSSNVPAAIDIAGEGRLVGLHLIPEQDDGSRIGLTSLRLPEPLGGMSFFSQEYNVDGNCVGKLCTLDGGTYLMYLVADGAPVEVTVRFGGAEGGRVLCLPGSCSTDADSLTPVGSAVQTPDPTTDLAAGSAAAVRSAGARESFVDSELMLLLSYGVGTSDTFPAGGPEGTYGYADHGYCIYREFDPPMGVQPGCPGSTDPHSGITIVTTGPGYAYVDSYPIRRPSGDMTMGGWQAIGGPSDKFGVAVLKLDRQSGL